MSRTHWKYLVVDEGHRLKNKVDALGHCLTRTGLPLTAKAKADSKRFAFESALISLQIIVYC